MMKKLLVFMLVLGLASLANATINGVSLRVAGPYHGDSTYIPMQSEYQDVTDITLEPCDYIWIGVYNPIDGTPGTNMQKDNFMLGIVEPSPDTSWTGAYKMYVPPLVPGCPENEYYDVIDFGGGIVLDVWYLQLTDGSPTTANLAGILDAKQLHCDEPFSTDVVQLWDADLTGVLDSVTIHQVPEPATIALLGLGGLLLRRKK
jgi:hypothetical protein